MLTDTQIFNNKIAYLELLAKLNIDLTALTKYLDSIDYFYKPLTSQNFRAYPGGLCDYALDLYNELSQLAAAYCPNKYTDEDIIKVALFKDLYRASLYELAIKNVKNDATNQWEAVPYYKVTDNRPAYGDIGFSSYMIAKSFIQFTDEQIEAIINSEFKGGTMNDIQEVRKNYKLVTLTGMADIVCYYLLDNK